VSTSISASAAAVSVDVTAFAISMPCDTDSLGLLLSSRTGTQPQVGSPLKVCAEPSMVSISEPRVLAPLARLPGYAQVNAVSGERGLMLKECSAVNATLIADSFL